MAKEVSYEEVWGKTHSLFASNESSSDEMVEHVGEENFEDSEMSFSEMEQLEVTLTSHVDGDKKILRRAKKTSCRAKKTPTSTGKKNNNAPVVKKYKRKGKANVRKVGGCPVRASAEKERRRKDANLYKVLRSLLPELPPKAPKATVVGEAIRFVMSLTQTLNTLENEKLERLCNASNNITMAPLNVPSQTLALNNETPFSMRMLNNNSAQSSNTFKTWSESNVALSMCGIDASLSICSLRNPNLFSTICTILERHSLDVVSVQISSDHAKTMYMFHVRANLPPEFAEGFPYEELFKKAAAQIMFFVDF